MKYKYIVFDVDGTLMDSHSYLINSLKNITDTDIVNVNSLLGLTSIDALKKLGIEDTDNFKKKWEDELKKSDSHIELFNGMRETLVILKEAGYSLGIVTSMYGGPLKNKLYDMKLISLFDIIVSADMTEYHKPHPEPLEKFIELSNTSADKILYIGDSSADYYCAKSAKVDFVEAGWGSYSHMDSKFEANVPTDLLKFLIV